MSFMIRVLIPLMVIIVSFASFAPGVAASQAASEHGGEAGHGEEHAPYPWFWRSVDFLLIVLLFWWLNKKAGGAIGRFFRGRTNEIRQNLENSREMVNEADQQLDQAKQALADASTEIERIISEGKQSIEREKQQLIEQTEKKLEKIKTDLSRQIEEQIDKAKKELLTFVVSDAISSAESKIKSSLKRSKTIQQKLIDKGLDKKNLDQELI